MGDKYNQVLRFKLSDYQLRTKDYPRPTATEGVAQLYGDHYGFTPGTCKRCEKNFDITFKNREQCDFHLERSKYYNRRHHPYGCCGKPHGSSGCRIAPSHVYKGNLYTDLTGYQKTCPASEGESYKVYAIDTESVHTVKGLELCRATVVDTDLNVVYDEMCIPASEIVDHNTIWSGIKPEDLEGVTKTYQELREDIFSLVKDKTILIGHGLSFDLVSLKMLHDTVVDTIVMYPHERNPKLKKSLKDLASTYLGKSIQTGEGHCSKEDAVVAMQLVLRKI